MGKAARADSVALAARVRILVTRLARILRQQDAGSLTPSLSSALATVHRGGRVTLSAIAAREHVAAPTVTRIVDKLEAEGLVKRSVSETDGRVVYAEVTDAGRRLVEETRSRRTAWLAMRLAQLDEGEVDLLRRAAPVLERLADLAREEETP